MISKEEKDLKERMQYVLRIKNITIADFADHDETARVRFSHHITGSGKVQFDTILKFLSENNEIDANWLLLGEGNMIKTKQSSTKVYNTTEANDSNVNGNIYTGCDLKVVPSEDDVDGLRKRIVELEKDKEVLQNVIAAFTAGVKK